ncbi:D-aspartate oxidase-like isoform X2 [Macrotis lagotis]|uniref:D-aspartate oxidase-like isoform X2 n=1 Tax=Macrotis lagotis TaxID=92651 RepID=UPI003D69EAE7
MDTTRVAVIGAGVIGLSTAVCISESIPQCSIDVISDKFTPDTTSDVAAGILIPHVYPENPVHLQKQWFQETFDRLFAIANSSEAIDAGIHLISGLRGSGGQVHIRKVEDLWEFYGSYDIVINCSGLGSRELLGDLQLFPVRGQVLKVQAPWVKHFIRDEEGLTYIYPGTFDVTLGGTRQKDDWNLSPDPQNSREILARCQTLEPSLQGAWGIKEKVGLRPSRPGVRLQKEILVQDGHRLPVVHNYGHGSGGFCVHWGTALQAVQLVKELITTLKISTSKAKL